MWNFNVNFPLNYQVIYVSIDLDVFAIYRRLEFASNLASKLSHKLDVVLRESNYANIN
jgi:hypothetical protein